MMKKKFGWKKIVVPSLKNIQVGILKITFLSVQLMCFHKVIYRKSCVTYLCDILVQNGFYEFFDKNCMS